MNLQTKRCIQFLGVGAAVGLLGLGAFVVVLMVSKGSSLHSPITELFGGINKPLELLPWAKDVAERQDPLLSIGFMAVYWAALGMVVGAIAFTIFATRRKATN